MEEENEIRCPEEPIGPRGGEMGEMGEEEEEEGEWEVDGRGTRCEKGRGWEERWGGSSLESLIFKSRACPLNMGIRKGGMRMRGG